MNWTAALAQVTDDGSTVRAYTEASARGNGPGAADARALLEERPFPMPLTYLWHWWGELHDGRTEGAHGLAKLSHLDIEAWANRSGRDPEPWEIALLLKLDRVWNNPVELAS